jgi:hypothetical protein
MATDTCYYLSKAIQGSSLFVSFSSLFTLAFGQNLNS